MRTTIVFIFFFLINKPFAQCDCCYTHIFYNQNDLVNFFPGKSIKSESFKKAIITESELDSLNNVVNVFPFAEVEFDNNGNYFKYKGFHFGIYNHQIDYKRNVFGKIKSSRMGYLDSLGNEMKNFGKMPTRDYKYSKWKLYIQNRDYENQKVPSSEATLLFKKYDLKGREKYFLSQIHTKDAIQIHHLKHEMVTEFNKKEYIGIRTHRYQDTLNGVDTINFDNQWRMIKIKSYFPKEGSFLHYRSEYWEYDSRGNRTLYKSVNPTGLPNSECSDQGDFELRYEYSENDLLQSVTYTYESKVYQMKFKYE